MADYYADSSALVKRHVFESGSGWFQILTDPGTGHAIITARLSMAEVYSALNRRRREATLPTADYARIVTDFDALCVTQYTLVELTAPIVERARRLVEQHPLRAYDAVHLASALAVNESLMTAGLLALTFVSADQRLLQAAQLEGLATDNPNTHL